MPRFPLATIIFLFFPFLIGLGALAYLLAATSQEKSWWIVGGIYTGISFIFGIVGLQWFVRQWWNPYQLFFKQMQDFTHQKSKTFSRRSKRKYWIQPYARLYEMEQYFEDVIHFATHLAQQKNNSNIGERLLKSPFAPRLQEVRKQLLEKEQEKEKQNWTMRGLALFSDILRNSDHLELETLASYFLRQLVKYLGAQQGVIYILNEEDKQDPYLELIANYAITKTDFDNKRIEIDEGLTGECFKKRKF